MLKRNLHIVLLFWCLLGYTQIDHHFFFLNDELVNSDPVDYTPGTKYLSEVDYNEGGNSGYPSASSNFFTSNVSMTPFCPSARKSVYNFRQKTGLKYTRASGDNFDNYTITVVIKFNTTPSSYYRVIDFSNGSSDNGVYNYQNNLNFFPNGNVRANAFSPNNFTFLTLTRDAATNIIDVYINDALVTTYADFSGDYKFNSTLIFARDNIPPSSAPNEDTNGQIAYIHVTNTKSTAAEVKDVYDNICSLIPPNIQANDDSASDAHGDTGEVGLLNVLDNDTRDDVAVTLTDVTMSVVTPDATGHITLNNDGTVDLAPNTPVGNYTIVYRICDNEYPTICDNGTVTVSVLPIPQVLSTTDNLVCYSGTATITATPSAGDIRWYDAPSGGNLLGTGTSFVTPIINTTTTYYAEAFEGSWRVSPTRTPVTVTVESPPLPTADATQYFCDIDNAIINDLVITGNSIRWYATDTSSSLLKNDDPLVNNTTYYATQVIGGCESNPRLPVTVVLNETVVPLAQADIPNLEGCDDNNDGYFDFDLTQNESILLNGKSAGDFSFEYFEDSARTVSIANPNAFPNTVANQNQDIFVRISNNADINCYTDVSFTIIVRPTPVLINATVALEQCDDDTDGVSLFNLTEANELMSSNHLNETITYYQTQAEAQGGQVADQITNFINYQSDPNPASPQNVIFARIENSFACFKVAQINLVVGVSQIPASFQTLQYVVCDDEQVDGDKRNGIATFDFSNATQIITNLFTPPHNFTISYYTTLNDALAEINAIQDISNHRNDASPDVQDIYVRIDSDVLNGCLGLGHHITLTVEALPIAHPVTFATMCEDGPTDSTISYPFDTSNLESDLLQGQTNVMVEYFDANGNPLTDMMGNPIVSPFPNTFRTETQTISVRVTNTTTNTNNNTACYDETQIVFVVDQQPQAFPVTIAPLCDDGTNQIETTDGKSGFNTIGLQDAILGGQMGMDVVYTDENGAILPTPLPNPFVTGTQTVTVTVSNPVNLSCEAITTLDFVVNPLPQFEVEEDRVVCTNLEQSIDLEVLNPQSNDYTYSWTNSLGHEISTQSQITVSIPDDYTVIATSNLGCPSLPRIINVAESTLPTTTIDDIDIVENSNNNSITINNVGGKGYDFAIDNEYGPYQDEPYFDSLVSGEHIVYVRSKEGCGIAEIKVFILGFPKYFTPNNDGYHDTWQVQGLSHEYTNASKVSIYDRYGKLIKQLKARGNNWNGLFNGSMLPSSDYWFVAELVTIQGETKVFKGHFSLIR